MASKILQTKSLSCVLILSYIVTITLPPVSISHNLSLAAVIAIFCLLVEIPQKQLLSEQFNKHLFLFAAPLLLIWVLATSVGIFLNFESLSLKNFPKIIHQPLFFNLVFFIFLTQFLTRNQQFMMVAIKIFMAFSTIVAVCCIIIVALFFDTYLISTTKNLEIATTLHLIEHFSFSITFNIDGRLSLANQNPSLVGMQFLFAALIAVNLLIKAITTKNRLLILWYLIILTILATAMSFTGTRTALISLLVTSIICSSIALFSKSTNKIFVTSAFLIFSALNIAATFLNPAAVNRNITSIIYVADMVGLNSITQHYRAHLPEFYHHRFDVKATGGREDVWSQYLKIAQEHVPWGAGFIGVAESELVKNRNVDGVPSSHLIVLDIYAWAGIPGLLLMLCSVLTGLKMVLHSSLSTASYLAVSLLCSFGLYSLMFPVATDKLAWLILCFAISLSGYSNSTKRQTEQRTNIQKDISHIQNSA